MSQIPIYFLLSLPLVGAFAMFSLGVVAIYQASRVLNLAHGAMAMVPVYVLFELNTRGVPLLLALPVAIASGALLGVAVERVFIRVLRGQSPTAQTVGTVAALGMLVSISAKVFGTTPRVAVDVFPEGGIAVGASLLRYGHIGLFFVALLSSAAFFALFRFTDMGLAMRAAAQNRRAAALMGVDADRTTAAAWAIGGTLAGLGGILLAPVTTLHPYSLTLIVLPAFVAALMGGLESFTGAVLGAAIVGIAQGMVPAIALIPVVGEFGSQVGAAQVVVGLIAFTLMYLRGDRFSSSDVRAAL
ncbi:MAG TPA: branched-chain amino acid ABC transporter permease [Acidimicrobiales bacterium]